MKPGSAINHSGDRGGTQPSPRQLLAQEFADYLGGTVERVLHHPARKKRFYRVVPRPGVVIDVHYPTYITVNCFVYRNANEARLAAYDAVKKAA